MRTKGNFRNSNIICFSLLLVVTLSFFMSWHSSPAMARDFSISSEPIVIGLPKWDGRDFVLMAPKVDFPLRKLPEGWFVPKIFQLPRDLNRGFDP